MPTSLGGGGLDWVASGMPRCWEMPGGESLVGWAPAHHAYLNTADICEWLLVQLLVRGFRGTPMPGLSQGPESCALS